MHKKPIANKGHERGNKNNGVIAGARRHKHIYIFLRRASQRKSQHLLTFRESKHSKLEYKKGAPGALPRAFLCKDPRLREDDINVGDDINVAGMTS